MIDLETKGLFFRETGLSEPDRYPDDVIPFGEETFKEALYGNRKFSALHAEYLKWVTWKASPAARILGQAAPVHRG